MSNNEIKTNNKKLPLWMKIVPFSLSVFAILFDQITKIIVNANFPLDNISERFASSDKVVHVFGDFLQIIHVRNIAVAFSIGQGLPNRARTILFSIIPLLVIIGLCFIIVKSDDLNKLQRWSIAGIIGGGLGNIIDRIFRPNGVVDFIDFKWFNIPRGWSRFPTFNIADCFVTVCAVIFIVAIIIKSVKAKKESQAQDNENE